MTDAPLDDPLQTHKRPAAYEKDIGRIDGRELLVRMLSAALRGDIRHGSL